MDTLCVIQFGNFHAKIPSWTRGSGGAGTRYIRFSNVARNAEFRQKTVSVFSGISIEKGVLINPCLQRRVLGVSLRVHNSSVCRAPLACTSCARQPQGTS